LPSLFLDDSSQYSGGDRRHRVASASPASSTARGRLCLAAGWRGLAPARAPRAPVPFSTC